MVIQVIFGVAALTIFISYLFKDILNLRIWAAIGASLYITAALIAGLHVSIMLAAILNLLVNLYHITRLILDRKPILVPQELKPIYEKTFSRLTPHEFNYLYKLAEIDTKTDTEIIKENAVINHLYVILDGTAEVYRQFKKIASLDFGSFLGEFSYLSGEKTQGTVIAKGELKYLSWDKQTIEKLKDTKPELYMKLQNILGLDLIKKLTTHGES